MTIRNISRFVRWSVLALAAVLIPSNASATAQWARKYQTSCQTCHTQFPRLNYYGERFMRNGYQDPDDENADGDTLGKTEMNDRTFIDELRNYLSFRLNVDAIRLRTNKLTVNGEKETERTFGNPNWVQFFVAGSIFKDVSIFIEDEVTTHGTHFSWYKLSFTNLGSSAFNVQIGNLSPRDWTSYSGRLRMFAPFKGPAFKVKSNGGVGDDSVNISSARPGIQYWGYKGPAFWFAGVTTGAEAPDPNDHLHYWLGLRFDVPESADSSIEGSNLSLWHYSGTDAVDTDTDEITGDFSRNSIAANLRLKELDLQAMYVKGEDDNWNMSTDPRKVNWTGISFSGAYMIDGKWYPAIAYDEVSSSDEPSIEKRLLTPSISYDPRENFRVGLYATIDLYNENGHTKSNDIRINLRTMF